MIKIKVLLVTVMLPAMLGGCAATEYLATLPDDTTLVFVPSSSAPQARADSDKATCLDVAYQKAAKARDNRILPKMASQAASIAGGATLGGLLGGVLFGHGGGGYAATGAVIGATAGAASSVYGGVLGAYLASRDPDQAAFDAAFAKCAEEHGHTVRIPGQGQSGPAPGVRF